MPKLLQFTRLSWGKLWFDGFALSKKLKLCNSVDQFYNQPLSKTKQPLPDVIFSSKSLWEAATLREKWYSDPSYFFSNGVVNSRKQLTGDVWIGMWKFLWHQGKWVIDLSRICCIQLHVGAWKQSKFYCCWNIYLKYISQYKSLTLLLKYIPQD